MKRGRRKNAAFRAGLVAAAKRRQGRETIQGMKSASIRKQARKGRRGPRLRPGLKGGRLYPQKGIVAKQRIGLMPTSVEVGSVLVDDPSVDDVDT